VKSRRLDLGPQPLRPYEPLTDPGSPGLSEPSDSDVNGLSAHYIILPGRAGGRASFLAALAAWHGESIMSAGTAGAGELPGAISSLIIG
jgi:hypothetical protein